MEMDMENVISTFEKIISVCKEDGCDFVDLTFEDAEQILALLKEQKPEEEKIPEYPCKNCCSPSERAACCGCEKERQWQTKYGKQKGQ